LLHYRDNTQNAERTPMTARIIKQFVYDRSPGERAQPWVFQSISASICLSPVSSARPVSSTRGLVVPWS